MERSASPTASSSPGTGSPDADQEPIAAEVPDDTLLQLDLDRGDFLAVFVERSRREVQKRGDLTNA